MGSYIAGRLASLPVMRIGEVSFQMFANCYLVLLVDPLPQWSKPIYLAEVLTKEGKLQVLPPR
ncbi:hypothetical protein LY04_01403 [Oceanimonas baumannii]|uniref:Uncharacterized protein n=1 Tax=Oceanimonas baumannii TaxID=129578 RepID=A0ABY2F072_9GAMM|nr:hypothetical protein LY04_01403 [Oceanimonas baumannii]